MTKRHATDEQISKAMRDLENSYHELVHASELLMQVAWDRLSVLEADALKITGLPDCITRRNFIGGAASVASLAIGGLTLEAASATTLSLAMAAAIARADAAEAAFDGWYGFGIMDHLWTPDMQAENERMLAEGSAADWGVFSVSNPTAADLAALARLADKRQRSGDLFALYPVDDDNEHGDWGGAFAAYLAEHLTRLVGGEA